MRLYRRLTRNNYFETEWGADERGDGGTQGIAVTKIKCVILNVALKSP